MRSRRRKRGRSGLGCGWTRIRCLRGSIVATLDLRLPDMPKPTSCPVCQADRCAVEPTGHNSRYTCARCGPFTMTGSADAMIKLEPMTDRQTTNASGWLRDHPNSVIVAENLPALITASPPSVAERADRILR